MSRADGFVTHEAVILKLRELKFEFRRQADRVVIYRRGSDGRRVEVPRRDRIPIAWVKAQFRLLGLEFAEIERFISDAGC